MNTSRILAAGALAVLLCGCDQFNKALETKPDNKGIIGKTTQDIGKADPDKKQELSDQKIQATDPVTAPLAAYGPMVERVSMAQIDHAVNLFNASEGRYPKDYDEFMEKIIKANNIRLPVLPYGAKYQYNEQTHALEIVKQPQQPAQ
jgi:hypothetical protein